MPRTPTSVPGNLLTQLGVGASGQGGRSDAQGAEAFHSLLPGQGNAKAQGAAAPAAGGTSGDAGSDAGPDTAAKGGAGLAQKGASAAQLVATKVTVAGGLRTLEAETMQAIRAALDAGDRTKAMALLKGAAQVVGAMLGGTDAARGTNAIDRLAAAQAALKDGAGAAQKPGGKGAQADPLTQAAAMFALMAQALGLVRPAAAAAAAQGGAAAVPQAAGAAKGTPAAGSLAALLDDLTRAGQAARGAEGAPLAGSDLHPGAAPTAGKDGAAKFAAATAAAAKHEAAAKLTDKRVPDPMALLAQAGAGAGGADGRAAALLAGAGAVVPPADAAAAGAAGAATQASAAQASAPQSQAAAFAGMLGTQIRAAQPLDGVTRIALSPRGLGEIQIDMKRDSSGRLNVVLRVENPLVLAALRNDHMRLSQMFASSASGAPPVLDFEAFTGRDGQGGQQQPRQAAQALAALGGAEAGDASEADGSAAPRQDRIGRGALDIRT